MPDHCGGVYAICQLVFPHPPPVSKDLDRRLITTVKYGLHPNDLHIYHLKIFVHDIRGGEYQHLLLVQCDAIKGAIESTVIVYHLHVR